MDSELEDNLDPIAEFFALYPEFHYNPSASFLDEFFSMCEAFGWKVGNDNRRLASVGLQDAMMRLFNDPSGLLRYETRAWQNLCAALKVEPAPETLWECRKIVMKTHVNICDLFAAPVEGKPCIFKYEWELAEYSRRSAKYYPAEYINPGSLLRYLLRQMRG